MSRVFPLEPFTDPAASVGTQQIFQQVERLWIAHRQIADGPKIPDPDSEKSVLLGDIVVDDAVLREPATDVDTDQFGKSGRIDMTRVNDLEIADAVAIRMDRPSAQRFAIDGASLQDRLQEEGHGLDGFWRQSATGDARDLNLAH
jgi:hypothetical protein